MGRPEPWHGVRFSDFTPPDRPPSAADTERVAHNAMQLSAHARRTTMHYTFRCKLDAGTPADVMEGAHVYVEMETLDDLDRTMDDVARAYTKAIDAGTSTAFLDEVVMRDLYPDGEDRPGDDPAPQVAEAIANLRMARGHVETVYHELRPEPGTRPPLPVGCEPLDQALADIDQAIRFLTGEEVPS